MTNSSEEKGKRIIEEIALDRRKQWESSPSIRAGIRLVGVRSQFQQVFMELIQNADDARATEIAFVLHEDRLYVVHDGKPFDKDDVESICSVGVSKKKRGKNIGFMGIGFKAVFHLTTQPKVYSHSNELSFRFSFDDETYIIPKWVEATPEIVGKWLEEKTTLIELELKENVKSDRISSVLLSEIDPYFLLVLNSIDCIRVEAGDKERVIERKALNRATHSFEIVDMQGENSRRTSFIVTKHTARIPAREWDLERRMIVERSGIEETQIAFAFPCEQETRAFKSGQQFNLYAFFPMISTPKIPFIVHADFDPTTGRENLVGDNEWNRWLFEEISDRLEWQILRFLRQKQSRSSILGILPVQSVGNELEELLFRPLFERLRRNRVVETSDGSLALPSVCIIAPPWFVSLFDSPRFRSHLATIQQFEQTPQFAACRDTEVLEKRLGVRRLNNGDTPGLLNTTLELASKAEDVDTPAWFEHLYVSIARAYNAQSRETTTRTEKEFRMKVGQSAFFLAADGRIVIGESAFLPPKKSRAWLRDSSLPGIFLLHRKTLTEESREALRVIGIEEITREKAVRSLLESCKTAHWTKWTPSEMQQVLRFVTNYLRGSRDSTLKSEIQQGVHPGIPVPTTDKTWVLSGGVYLDSGYLREILPKSSTLDAKYVSRIEIEKKDVIETLGIRDIPRIKRARLGKSYGFNRRGCGTYSHYRDWKWQIPDGVDRQVFEEYFRALYDWDLRNSPPMGCYVEEIVYLAGFDQIIQNQSGAMWLERVIRENWSRYYSSFLGTSCRWETRKNDVSKRYLPSLFLLKLQEAEWIAVDGKLVKPCRLFWPSEYDRRLLGDTVAYLPQRDSGGVTHEQMEEFYRLIGIISKPTIDDLQHVLDDLSAMPEFDAGRLDAVLVAISEQNLRSIVVYGKLLPNTRRRFVPADELVWIDDPSYLDKLDNYGIVAYLPGMSYVNKERIFSYYGVKRVGDVIPKSSLIPELKNVGSRDENFERKLRSLAWHVFTVLVHFGANQDEARQVLDFTCACGVIRSEEQLQVVFKLDEIEYRIDWDVYVKKDENQVVISSNLMTLRKIVRPLLEAFISDSNSFEYEKAVLQIKSIIDREPQEAESIMKEEGIDLVEPGPAGEPSVQVSVAASEQGVSPMAIRPSSIEGTGRITPPLAPMRTPLPLISGPAPLVLPETRRTERHPGVISPRPPSPDAPMGTRSISPDAYEMGEYAEEKIAHWEIGYCKAGTFLDYRKEADRGYDFSSEREDGVRHIEVKGWYGGQSPVLTPQEYCIARKEGEQYYLYIAVGRGVIVIQNPVKNLSDLSRIGIGDSWQEKKPVPWNE